MSYIDEQVQLYPELLRRLAAGERLASRQDETEKLAATAIVVEALENERSASPKNGGADPQSGHEKQGLIAELGIGAMIGAYGPRVMRKLRGEPDVPETAAELLKGFRRIIQEKEKAEAAKRMAIAAGVGGVAAGALAVKALQKDEKESSDESANTEKVSQSKPNAENLEEKKEAANKSASSRAMLGRLLRSFK